MIDPGAFAWARAAAGRSRSAAGRVDPVVSGRLRCAHEMVTVVERLHHLAEGAIAELVTDSGRFDTLRLRTSNPEAARLYAALGFARSAKPGDATHLVALARAPRSPAGT